MREIILCALILFGHIDAYSLSPRSQVDHINEGVAQIVIPFDVSLIFDGIMQGPSTRVGDLYFNIKDAFPSADVSIFLYGSMDIEGARRSLERKFNEDIQFYKRPSASKGNVTLIMLESSSYEDFDESFPSAKKLILTPYKEEQGDIIEGNKVRISIGGKWLLSRSLKSENLLALYRGLMGNGLENHKRIIFKKVQEALKTDSGSFLDFQNRSFGISYGYNIRSLKAYLFTLANLKSTFGAYPNGLSFVHVIRDLFLGQDGQYTSLYKELISDVNKALLDTFPTHSPRILIFEQGGGYKYIKGGEERIVEANNNDICIYPIRPLPSHLFLQSMMVSSIERNEAFLVPNLMTGTGSFINAQAIQSFLGLPAIHDGSIDHIEYSSYASNTRGIDLIEEFCLKEEHVQISSMPIIQHIRDLSMTFYKQPSLIEGRFYQLFLRRTFSMNGPNLQRYERFFKEKDVLEELAKLLQVTTPRDMRTLSEKSS